jgi:hypothetical protein
MAGRRAAPLETEDHARAAQAEVPVVLPAQMEKRFCRPAGQKRQTQGDDAKQFSHDRISFHGLFRTTRRIEVLSVAARRCAATRAGFRRDVAQVCPMRKAAGQRNCAARSDDGRQTPERPA